MANSFPFEQQQQQKQYNPKNKRFFPKKSTILSPPQTQFVTHEDLEFYRIGNSSYRAAINTIERSPYVTLSHWFFNPGYAEWFPTRKQVFLPKLAWLALLEKAEQLTSVIEPIQDLGCNFQGKFKFGR